MPSIRFLTFLLPLVYLAALADASLAPRLAVAGAAPDAFALLALLWLSARADSHGFLAAGLIGLVADLCASGRLGPGMACYLLVGYATCHLLGQLPPQRAVARIAWLLPISVVLLVAIACCRWAANESSLSLSEATLRAASAGLYTAAIAALLLATFRGCTPFGCSATAR